MYDGDSCDYWDWWRNDVHSFIFLVQKIFPIIDSLILNYHALCSVESREESAAVFVI